MATHSSILAWKNSMDRGAWWAIVHGVPKITERVCVRARFLVFTVLLVLFMCAFSVLVGSLTFGGKKTFYSNFGRNPQAN